MEFTRFLKPLEVLADCTICPRNCHANRFKSPDGYCKSDASFNISSICIHQGEEPVIGGTNGICNIFFTHCNLQCIYCQNHQISENCAQTLRAIEPEEVLNQVLAILDKGITRVGFVSPSHFVPQVKAIIQMVESSGHHPVWVYNSNGYDKEETLKSLEGVIDVYLPDLKYMNRELAGAYSDAPDYPEKASRALKEMYRQKGASLIMDEEGTALSGLIIRHLVLPGNTGNSLKVLDFIAEELSTRVHISLMSQYYPTEKMKHHPLLKRNIFNEEYQTVIGHMEQLGFYNGWIQEPDSTMHYRPDFEKDHPFEDK